MLYIGGNVLDYVGYNWHGGTINGC